MTSADVAAYFGVSEDTVRRWVRTGRLTPVNPKAESLQRAKAYRFTRDAVEHMPPAPPSKPRKKRQAPTVTEYSVTTYTPPTVAAVERLLR